MKILYDHQTFSIQKYGGISRYYFELINRICVFQDINTQLSLKYSNNYYIEDANFSNHKGFLKNQEFRGKERLLLNLNGHYTKSILKKGNFDIFHPTYFCPYFLPHIGTKPFVLTVYDMVHEIFPQIVTKKDKTAEWKKVIAQKATKIIAISSNTKKDLINLYNIDSAKISVIHLGSSLRVETKNKTIKKNIPERYLLFVGARDRYKNFNRFLKAITTLLQNDNTLNLICVGGGNFCSEEIKLLEILKINSKVFQFFVNDTELVYLYKNALAFIFPSLYEGFGIPILESFECGCPLILSNTSSFPEIAGDSAVYFDPTDEISIKNAVEKVIYDNELREILISSGYNQAMKFSWDRTAIETEALYRSIL